MILYILSTLINYGIYILIAVIIYILFTSKRYTPPSDVLPSEKEFIINTNTGEKESFPKAYSREVKDPVTLSVVVPAYYEEKRLHMMIPETIDFLVRKSKDDENFSFEIIIVNDGSKDKTFEKALEFVDIAPRGSLRVLNLEVNRGKGGAIRRGVMLSRGDYILFADADGATQVIEMENILNEVKKIEKDGFGIVVGSRANLQKKAEVERTIFRNFLMWGFHIVCSVLGGIKTVKDTQCGFKIFTRKSALRLFSGLHLERWAFDVELLYLAQYYNDPLLEFNVRWKEIEGSHLEEEGLKLVSLKMLWDIFRCRVSYFFGVWYNERHDLSE